MSVQQSGSSGKAERSWGRERTLLIGLGVAVLLGACAWFGYRLLHKDTLATLIALSGSAERDRQAALEQWSPAAQGDEFVEGDGARTPAAATADFRLVGGARLRLQPASKIRFKRRDAGGAMRVDVEVGVVDVQTTQEAVTLLSEFGPIALDVNSRVTLSRSGGQLSVDVELGSLRLSNQTVAAGEQLLLELGGLIVDVPEPVPVVPPAPVVTEPVVVPALVAGDGVARADLVVKAGDDFVVHDPSPPTAIGFRVAEVCKGPARLIAGKQQTEALDQANLRFARGSQTYEVRCLDRPDVVAASGQVTVLADAGTRTLPTFAPTASVALDGRRYTILYQARLPKVTVTWPSAPAAPGFSLKVGRRTIRTATPTYTFQTLSAGTHQLVFTADTTPERQSRATTVEVVYDRQAPTARLSEPSFTGGEGDRRTVKGSALPGWSVAVGDTQVEVGDDRNFTVDVAGKETVPLTFSHPNHGTHYYLRRPTVAP
jgi:hypothetical protein